MKITLGELKALINEASKSKRKPKGPPPSAPPETFSQYRTMLHQAMSKIKEFPEELVEEVGFIDDEGGGVAAVLFEHWNTVKQWQDEIKSDLKDQNINDPAVLAEELWDCCVESIFNLIPDMIAEFNNPMNYPPGHRPKPLDVSKLTQKLTAVLQR